MKPHVRLRDIKCDRNYFALFSKPCFTFKLLKKKRKKKFGPSWNISGPQTKGWDRFHLVFFSSSTIWNPFLGEVCYMSLAVLGGRGGGTPGWFFFCFFFLMGSPAVWFSSKIHPSMYTLRLFFLLLTWKIIQHNPVQVPPSSKWNKLLEVHAVKVAITPSYSGTSSTAPPFV